MPTADEPLCSLERAQSPLVRWIFQMMFQIDQDFRDTFISYLGPCLAGAKRFELAWNTFHQSQQTQPTRHHVTYYDSLAPFWRPVQTSLLATGKMCTRRDYAGYQLLFEQKPVMLELTSSMHNPVAKILQTDQGKGQGISFHFRAKDKIDDE